MQVKLNSIIHLLHQASSAFLATQSQNLAGYPFGSVGPFVLDEEHCPLLLISSLAEHAKNLQVDHRISLVVIEPGSASALKTARLTIVGNASVVEPSEELIARYMRYQPDAKQFLERDGFVFFKLIPKRLHYTAGIGEMGWLDENDWQGAAVLSLSDEIAIYRSVVSDLPKGMRLLGIDAYGFDVERNGQRDRHQFRDGPASLDNLREIIKRFLASL